MRRSSLPRDNQDGNCIASSRDVAEWASLVPQVNVPIASSLRIHCRMLDDVFLGRHAEHHLMRHLPSPRFHAALQRSQLLVRVDAWMFHLQPLQQLARRPPWLGLEPLRSCAVTARMGPDVAAGALAFCFARAVGRTSPSCQAVRSPERNCSSVGAVGRPHRLVSAGRRSPPAAAGRHGSHCSRRTGSRVACTACTAAFDLLAVSADPPAAADTAWPADDSAS